MENIGKLLMSMVIGLVIAGIALAYIFPIAMEAMSTTNVSNWSTASQDIWAVLPIFFIIVPLVAISGVIYVVMR